MSKKFYIYLITNKILNKQYVGSRTKYRGTPIKDNYMGSCTTLNQDYKIFGKENFLKEILIEKDYIEKEEILNAESEFILKYNTLAPNGYNRQLPNQYPSFYMIGKPAWNRGKKASEETIKKLRESHKGQVSWLKGTKGLIHPSEETKEKQRKAMLGKPNPHRSHPCSEETKEKLRKPRGPMSEESKQKMRKPKSEEARYKMSLSKKGKTSSFKNKKHSEESKQKMRENMKGRIPWNKI